MKKILCLDFDGVIHSYTSGWQGAAVISDPPVPGAVEFIANAVEYFRIAIFSSRSGEPDGCRAMMRYMREHLTKKYGNHGDLIANIIEYPIAKPPAFVTIDDRAITFTGTWPAMDMLLAFKPWNMRK